MEYITHYLSPLGELTICSDGESITGLWKDRSGALRDDLPVFAAARDWLDRYFRGERPDPNELPLSPAGTDFQKQVWYRLLEVPYGETRRYSDIAREIGKPRACQAVGQAVGRNPISIIIPCHRIIGADGSLTGFAGGLDMKRQLLNHEKKTRRLITVNEYQKEAMRTLNPAPDKKDILINAVMGLCGESGEAIDIVKKWLAQGHELDREKLVKELGDIAWYLAEAATALDLPLEQILAANVEKLRGRFPAGFSAEASRNRADAAEGE